MKPRLLLPALLVALAFAGCSRVPKAAPAATTAAPDATMAAPVAQASATPAIAAPPADNAPAQPPSPGNGNRQMQDPAQRAQQRLEQMKTSLALTDDQAQKIKAIFDAQRPAMEALRNDQDRQDRRAKMKELRDARNAQIATILTPDQKTKWDAEQAQARAQGGNGGGGNGGGGRRGGGGNGGGGGGATGGNPAPNSPPPSPGSPPPSN